MFQKAYVVAPQLPAELKVNVATTGKKGWNEEKVQWVQWEHGD